MILATVAIDWSGLGSRAVEGAVWYLWGAIARHCRLDHISALLLFSSDSQCTATYQGTRGPTFFSPRI